MDIMEYTLLVITLLAALSACILLWLIRHPKTPRALDFIVGVQLIVFAAFFLGLLGDLRELVPDENKVKAGYDVALLIIPFFTAGLGTNIISHVVLSRRDYEGTVSVNEVGGVVAYWLVVLFGIIMPFLLLIYVIYCKCYKKAF